MIVRFCFQGCFGSVLRQMKWQANQSYLSQKIERTVRLQNSWEHYVTEQRTSPQLMKGQK